MRAPSRLLLTVLLLTVPGALAAQLVPDWGDQSFSPLRPLDPSWLQNPVLRADDIAEPRARFVADPFLYRGDDRWWLFFELLLEDELRGVIAVASSTDGRDWAFDRVVLSTPAHLSYPLVFRWERDFYMMPCSDGGVVRLFRASPSEFPYTWTSVDTLLSGRPFADPTVFRHADRWWLFVSDGASEMLWLYSSDCLTDPAAWHEHPASPLVNQDRRRARPAGRVLHLAGDRLIRLAQRSDHVYGEQVRAFAITRLDAERYEERELLESPVLTPGPDPWHDHRMHTLDPWWTGERWLCAVDGYDGQYWSIGIYCDDPAPLAAPATGAAVGLDLVCRGWRGNAPLTLHCAVPGAGEAALALYDPEGRCLRRERLPAGAESREVEWAALDGAGRPLPSGVYLVVLRAAAAVAQRKVVLLR